LPLTLSLTSERWPIAGTFSISRGAKTGAAVVVAELSDGTARGRGECVPYARYGESVEGVLGTIEALRPQLALGLSRAGLQTSLPPGAARNALDCALWDLAAKRERRPVHELASCPVPHAVTTAFTISLAAPADMAKAAAKAASRALLKIKLGARGDPERIAAVRKAAPKAMLIVDANEGWDETDLAANLAACAEAGVVLVEQPLPEDRDQALASLKRPISVCADESAHGLASMPALGGKYDAVNIKLDKAGGLTEALAMAAVAERMGLAVMAGCMVATSLAMAPAMLIAQAARFVDLDGPLLLTKDRDNGLRYEDSLVYPAAPALWG
jgi:L-alanine-DL-glutamate epimerase-like enolase superfamily enzyme